MADSIELQSKKRDTEIVDAQKYGETGLENPDALLQNLEAQVDTFKKIEADLAALQQKVDDQEPGSEAVKANEKKYLQVGDNEGVFLEYFPKKTNENIEIVFYLTLQVAEKTYSVDVTKLIEEDKFSKFLQALSEKLKLKEHTLIAPDLAKIRQEVNNWNTTVATNKETSSTETETQSNPGQRIQEQITSIKETVTGRVWYGTMALTFVAGIPALLKSLSGKDSPELSKWEQGIARAKQKRWNFTTWITGVVNGERVETMTPVTEESVRDAVTPTATAEQEAEYQLVWDEASDPVQKRNLNLEVIEKKLDFTHYPKAKVFYSTYLKQYNDIPYINKRWLSYTHMNVGNVKQAEYFCKILDTIGIPYETGKRARDGGRFLVFHTYGHGMLAQFLMLDQFYRSRDLEWWLLAYSGGLSETPTNADKQGKMIPGMWKRYKRWRGNRYGYDLVNWKITWVSQSTTFGQLSTEQMWELMKLIRKRESGLWQELLNIKKWVA